MTTAIKTSQEPATREQAARITQCWRGLLDQPIRDQAEVEQIQQDILRLRQPASARWVGGRAVSLLAHYYVADLSPEIMEAVADDWMEELMGFPAWSVEVACKWWMSRENPDRRKRPLPGDISIRARKEIGIIRVAEMAVERHLEGKPPLRLVSERDNG